MKKTYLAILVLSGLILIPALFRGGRQEIAILIFFILLFFYVLLTKKVLNKPCFLSWTLIIWLAWIIINTLFFSTAPYDSALILFQLIGGGIIFYLTISANFSTKSKELFAKILIGGAAVLVLIGLIFFSGSPQYAYLRFYSTFYQHNAFAGFLILPLILSVGLIFKKREGKREDLLFNLLSITVTYLLFIGLFLTFSRGGYISSGISLIIFLLLFLRITAHKKYFLKKLLLTVLVIVLASGTAYSIFKAKEIAAQKEGETLFSPYQVEQVEATGFKARLLYMKQALVLFKKRPLTGYGLDSFNNEARRIQNDLRFYSTDPHNLYLRFFAELGLIGGLLFVIFVGWLIFGVVKHLAFNKVDVLYASFLAGFIGMLIHNGVDVDFQFPANVFLFFTVAAILAKMVSSLFFPRKNRLDTIFWLLLGTSLFLAIASLFVLLSSHFPYLNPLNPYIKIDRAIFFLRQGELEKAAVLLEQAEQLHPNERRIYLARASLFEKSNNIKGAEEAYKKALFLAPYRDLEPVLELVNIYLKEKRTPEARLLIQEALDRFPAEAIEAPIWRNPNKQQIKLQIAFLKNLLHEM